MTLFHHATVKKAEKLGVVLSQPEGGDRILAHWAERNKKGFAANSAGAPGLVEDMAKLRMITLEFPKIKVEQPNIKKDDYGWTISLRGDEIGSGVRLADAWDEALDVLEGGEEGEDGEDDADDLEAGEDDAEEGDGTKSVVKKKYKSRYRPFRMTCGDEISQLISAHVKYKDEAEGKMRIDRAKLVKFAKLNGVWDPKYQNMNVGMVRMNAANRLRGKIRRDKHEVIWG